MDRRHHAGRAHSGNAEGTMSTCELVILGAGESGVGAALLAQQKGIPVFVSDRGGVASARQGEMQQAGIAFESGKHSEDRILAAEEVVKSPGIPDSAPLIRALRDKGVPVISEIEFAARFSKAYMVCITGTNGKTTTTALTHHCLAQGGLKAGRAGNIGPSLSRYLYTHGDQDVFVLELSSFQLDGLIEFKADVAMLLNITPDHLDRYNYDFSQYIASKFGILRNQTAADHFIYSADDQAIAQYVAKQALPMHCYPVSTSRSLAALGGIGAGVSNNEFSINTHNQTFTMKIQELALQGKHNLFNSMAAGVTSRIFELRKDLVRDSLANFENLEHRLEFVAKVNDVTFINDSKATNVNSTWYAIESMDKPTVWIAGGVDKGNDYDDLLELVKEKVKAIICLGVDNTKLCAAFAHVTPTIIEVQSADEAVKVAYELAHAGDAVLLSPACASFDLFENYEDRGQQFKAAVRRL